MSEWGGYWMVRGEEGRAEHGKMEIDGGVEREGEHEKALATMLISWVRRVRLRRSRRRSRQLEDEHLEGNGCGVCVVELDEHDGADMAEDWAGGEFKCVGLGW